MNRDEPRIWSELTGSTTLDSPVRLGSFVFLGLAMGVLACSAPPSDEPVSSVSSDLYGPTSYGAGCTADMQRAIDKGMFFGRVASASSLFSACMQQAMTTGLSDASVQYYPVGPYMQCLGDPYYGYPLTTQINALMAATHSSNGVHMDCDDVDNGANASAALLAPGTLAGDEAFTWHRWFEANYVFPEQPDGWPFSQIANTAWHEALHQHGYTHGANDQADAVTACGYPSTSSFNYQVNTSNYIAGSCIQSNIETSANTCGLHSHKCPAGLMMQSSLNSTTCVCQPDPIAPGARIGVFNGGGWYLDMNGNGIWEGTAVDRNYTFGGPGYIPVTGDWTGDGVGKIGMFFNGTWMLDWNGNGVWDGPSVDKLYNFGGSGDTPVVGDWTGGGTTGIGVFNSGGWYLDLNGNGAWDGATVDRLYVFGGAGNFPVVGDWSGTGTTKIGVFDSGSWYLDFNGNGAWDGYIADRLYNFGGAGNIPVAGDWTGSGTAKIGVFNNGTWYLDTSGDGVWETTGVDKSYVFGGVGNYPVVGYWAH